MRTKSLALLALALGCGLVASIGITQVMAKRNVEPSMTSGETENVFVALKDIALGDLIAADAVRVEQWPKDKVPTGVMTKIEDVEGRRARTKLYAGEPIQENKLFRKGAREQGPDALIPKGYRVISVKVDNVSGTSDMLQPGTRVDVMVYLPANALKGVAETTARTILQDIKVFAVNDVVHLEAKEQGGGKTITARTISLLVTPEQGAKVALASEMGSIRLIMRSPEDDIQASDAEARPQQLFGKSAAGDRDSENLGDTKPVAVAKPTGRSFLDLLNAARSKIVPPPVATTNNSWTMRILQPTGVNEIVLEPSGDAGSPSAGANGWKLAGSTFMGSATKGKGTAKPDQASAKSDPSSAKPDQPQPKDDPPQPTEPPQPSDPTSN